MSTQADELPGGVQVVSAPMSVSEWRAEGSRRFGDEMLQWQFVCPSCGHVATPQHWKDAGAPVTAVAFSCVGRWTGAKREAFSARDKGQSGPCNYAGGGLFRINPVRVVGDGAAGNETYVFAFADVPSDGGAH